MFRRLALRTLLPFAAVAMVCAADARAEDVSVQVSYAGLDLSSPAGVAVLRTRINNAIKVVCGASDARDLQASRQIRACREDLAANVEPKLVAEVDAVQNRLIAALPTPVAQPTAVAQ